MKNLRETEQKMKKLGEEVERMQVGRSQAFKDLMAQVAQLSADIVTLKAQIALLEKNKKDK